MRLLSFGLGITLGLSVVLPWFGLPLWGGVIPIPAWNFLGLGLIVLAGLHGLRALGVPGASWGVRGVWPWVFYHWWQSERAFRLWGKTTLAPLQLKLSGVNQALATVGIEPVSVFDPVAWRVLAPGIGWKLAGVSLVLALIVTALDWPVRRRCLDCQVVVSPWDRCCHGCGHVFTDVPGCLSCGRVPVDGDHFCRACGKDLQIKSFM